MHEFEKFDKQIYFVKIIMWEGCPLRCDYCFVDKDNGRVISESNLFRLIDLLLYSPWHNKLLHLLWWEPLLCFDLIKKAVIYARKLEKKLWKDLDISFCTSGLLFDEEKLEFIRDAKIYLAWSIDGPAHINDMNRKFWNGTGSFDQLIKKKQMVVKYIPATHLWIAMTVDTNTVDELFESYKYLVDTEGFDCTVNIAPVDGKIWTKTEQKTFVRELEKCHQYLFDQIWEGRNLYLNSINKEFRFKMLTAFRKEGGRCLWFYTEAFTNGDVLFNPFINKEEDYSKYVVGNIWDPDFMDKISNYIWCKFDSQSDLCKKCKGDYFDPMYMNLKDVKLNVLLRYRDRVSILFANKIRFAGKNNPKYLEYSEIAKDYMYV